MRRLLFPIALINSLFMMWFIKNIEYDTVALHYDIHGNTNYYGSKWMLLIFAAIPLILSLVFLFYKNLTKNTLNRRYNDVSENKIITIIFVFFIVIGWMITFLCSSNPDKLESWVLPSIISAFGMLIICISTFMPKIKQNRFLGIRTSATLKNENVWGETHKLEFYTGIIGGSLTVIFAFVSLIISVTWLYFVGIVFGILGVIIPAIYSYMIYKNQF